MLGQVHEALWVAEGEIVSFFGNACRMTAQSGTGPDGAGEIGTRNVPMLLIKAGKIPACPEGTLAIGPQAPDLLQ